MEINIANNSTLNSQQFTAVQMRMGQEQAQMVPPQGSGTLSMPTDKVDLVGLKSISQAFKALGKTEPLPVPEPVFRAIRALARDVLEGLPGGVQ